MTHRRSGPRKDRLIQTRVPQDLESTLKDEARKRRLSVSHLIRNVLEDTFDLVDNVVEEVDRVVADGIHVAETLRGSAERIRATATAMSEGRRERSAALAQETDAKASPDARAELSPDVAAAASVPAQVDLSDVYAWQPVVLNRAECCARCERDLEKGVQAHMGLSDQPGRRAWLCDGCVETL